MPDKVSETYSIIFYGQCVGFLLYLSFYIDFILHSNFLLEVKLVKVFWYFFKRSKHVKSEIQIDFEQNIFSRPVFNLPLTFSVSYFLSFSLSPHRFSSSSSLSSSFLSDEWCYGVGAALGVLCELGHLRLFLRLEPGSGCVERVSSSSFLFTTAPDVHSFFFSVSLPKLHLWSSLS